MRRRTFGQLGIFGIGAQMVHPIWKSHVAENSQSTFPLHYAPHPGMFRHHAGEDIIAQLEFVAERGFTAWEDNGMRQRTPDTQEAIGKAMSRLGIRMGVFVAHTIYWTEPNLASGNLDKRKEFLNEISASVEVAKRVNAHWMTVVPGHLDLKKDMGYQMVHVIESLKQASAILEPHDLVMVLEPLNFRDHPGLFLTHAAQAYEICKAVNSPACKILFDIYHQQITEGNLLPNIDATWDEIAYFQVGDNPGRKEPTTGEINYLNIFRHIHSRKFDGIIGMEHGNSMDGTEGEDRVIEAYLNCSQF
jgi:hydroxypyruvate isomerase